MNSLETYLAQHALDPIATMNRLMDAGIVSDNAVMPGDVAKGDCERAVEWLEQS